MPEGTLSDGLDILVVDDSPTYRMILSRAVRNWPRANLVGTAGDGQAALALIEEKHPHLVLLDISMPILDGIETLRRIRAKWSDVDVVMCSGIDANQTGLTMQALSLGALDFVAKPQGESPAESFAALAATLNPLLDLAHSRKRRRAVPAPSPRPATIASVATQPVAPRPAPIEAPAAPIRTKAPSVPPPPPLTGSRRPPGRIELVAIGVSTGGPNALQKLVPKIPGNFPVPIVCVQHMPPLFTASLAERLDRDSAISVREGAEGMVLQPGSMYIAPGGHHMVVARGADGKLRLALHQEPPVHSCRPSVDVLFRSLLAPIQGAVVTVVLTGMGADGADGAKGLRERGGWSIIQDEASSVVWGMPGAVHAAGAADEILPLESIANRLHDLLSRRSP
ncbi:MAG: chemotaxis-specific protein-glutamate methyltransferase CheB [Fibrobacterota bacterium]|nr:chemotaxis-specific protein-glutamate methyltransferase CheB [Fibrobacterota bacterium]QQS07295.1 MAG: chemotaxis-specific protein-glutamate methyltransferase CheB [Fibrobacterota bacterium]